MALERDFDWRGLCIEPNHGPLRGLAHRACTVVSAVVSDRTGRHVTFDTGAGSAVAGVVAEDTALRPADIAPDGAPLDTNRYHQMTTVDIGKILRDMQAPDVIDYLSLDVEGSEHLILSTFPFSRTDGAAHAGAGRGAGYTVHVVSIEHPDLCSRTVLRNHGFHFLKSLDDQDEVWVHESLPNFDAVVEEMGSEEPPLRRREAREALQATCRELLTSVARNMVRIP